MDKEIDALWIGLNRKDQPLTKNDFVAFIKQRENLAQRKLYVPSLTEETYSYIKFLFTPLNGDRAYWSYKHLSSGSGLSIDKCKEFTKVFKILGLVESQKGLLTEEGRAYGSGIGIPNGNQETVVELAILRYEAELKEQL